MTNATLNEFQLSAIDSDIIELNFRSIGQTEAFHFLKPNLQASDRRNDGRLRDGLLRTFNRLEAGGWVCTGIDPLTMTLSDWGCLKPNQPRWDEKKRKHIKYEHPSGVTTELFCLRVTYRVGLKIAKTQGLEIEIQYLSRMVGIDPTVEDVNFWQWVKDNPALKITITEGAKKAASLLSAGHLAIALPGIWGGYRSKINSVDCIPFLIPQLEIFATGEREFAFCFDQDTSPETIANVNKAIAKTGKLLVSKGCKVSVVSWYQPYKGVDDLIYGLGKEIYHQAFSSRQSLDKWQLTETFSISQLPQTTVNLSKPAFADLAPRPDTLDGILFAIRAAKGVGKTELIAKVLAPYRDAGRSILIITHRIQLAKELASRLGINHISEVRDSETGSLLGYSLCIDSLHSKSHARFNPEAWENAIVVIDECEQVFWHMLNSKTCQKNRVAILQTFEKLLRTVTNSNGSVILSDADLSKVSIDYIHSLTENRLKLWLLNNTHNPNKGNRELFVHNSPQQLLSAAHAAIGKGEKIIIHCSAQQTKSKWSAQNIESLLAKRFPELKILMVDAKTVSDPTHPAYGCIEHINEVAVGYDIVIATPTIETGISIDVKHFDSVWCLANGVQTVDAVCQTIERVRDDIPRHICITTQGISWIGNKSDSIRYLLHSEHKVYVANYRAISRVDEVAKLDDYTPAHLTTWGCYAARINGEFKKYEQNILDKLESEGYDLIPYAPDLENSVPTNEILIEIENARSENYKAEQDGVIGETNPSDIELATLKKKTAKTKQERYREAKGNLCRRYLTEDITHDLIVKDDNGWHPQLQLYYYLTIGREHLKVRDTAKLRGLSPEGHHSFKPDVNRLCLTLRIKALDAVNIQQFFGEDKTFTSVDLSGWHEKLLQCRQEIKEYLGISISTKSTPVQTAQQLLGSLGLKLVYIDRIRIDGELTRRYSGVNCNSDDRQAVLEAWLDQDNRIARMAECSTPSINSINRGGGTLESLDVA
jgi:Domain of unknown function (DUF3854)